MVTENEDNTIELQRFPNLYLKLNTSKGRGVFSHTTIPAGTIIDTSPVLILDPTENEQHIEDTVLFHYTYNWPAPSPSESKAPAQKTQAVVLGLGSMFNHSTHHQNVGWYRDVECQVIVYKALRDIPVGEELCISYGDRLTFEDADADENRDGDDDCGNEDADGGDILSKIELDGT